MITEHALDGQDIELLMEAIKAWEAEAADDAETCDARLTAMAAAGARLLGREPRSDARAVVTEHREWHAQEIRKREERGVLLRARLIHLRDQQLAEQLARDLTRRAPDG